jgi:hypothetical protein
MLRAIGAEIEIELGAQESSRNKGSAIVEQS